MHCESNDPTRALPVRHKSIRAALPLLVDDTPPPLQILQRISNRLQTQVGGRHQQRAAIPADVARLRRDMGKTIADMWSAPCEVVRRAY
jgi:hypothetical protein